MLERLKSRWNIQSNFQLLIIFIVFGITGSASVALGKPLLEFLQLQPENFQEVPLGTPVVLHAADTAYFSPLPGSTLGGWSSLFSIQILLGVRKENAHQIIF